MKKNLEDRSVGTGNDVAIIGIACRFPGAKDCREFWKNLEHGASSIKEIPSDRWDWKEYFGNPQNEPNKTNSRWGGFLDDVDKFDAGFFGISPREALLMDPQQRIFIEEAWKAIEDAGYKASDLSGTNTGVFAGVSSTDYNEILVKQGVEIEAHTTTGWVHAILANRVSYLFNFYGPSESIDTACSSSLVAIHRAVGAIREGNCQMAIVGGVNVILSPRVYISFSKAGMLSEDGRCKTFDSKADGYVRSEGAGVILLKQLDKAIADNDYIYGIIKGSAENHSGKTRSLTSPSTYAQSKLLIKAYESANISPDTISYIEVHGTGTPLGDPIEIHGLKRSFAHLNKIFNIKEKKEKYCGIGSVKSNIGHLESAAGIAGVIKVLLSMKYKRIPATVNFSILNPNIRLQDSPFYIVDKTKKWERLEDSEGRMIPRRAGVSSFGFGGTNAHVVIEGYEKKVSQAGNKDQGPQLFLLSAKNEERLKEYANEMLDYIKANGKNIALADMVYTLQVGREAMAERVAVIVSSMKELEEKLIRYCEGKGEMAKVYRGMGNRDRVKSEKSTEGITEKELIRRTINDRDLKKLAQLWVNGVEVSWELLWTNDKPIKMSLPTYPFAKKRYWIIENGQKEGGPVIQDNGSLEKRRFTRTLNKDEISLDDCVARKGQSSTMYYETEWYRKELDSQIIKQKGVENILIFDVNDKLAKAIKVKVEGKNEVILVRPGIKYHDFGGEVFEINLTEERDYGELVKKLTASFPSKIIYLWSRHKMESGKSKLSKCLEKSIFALFFLTKALLKAKPKEKIELLYIYERSIGKFQPDNSAISGFVKSLNFENEKFIYKTIELISDKEIKEKELLKIIMGEFGKGDDLEVRYEGGERYVKKLKETYLKEQMQPELPLRERGSYLITGGMGGLGLIFAEYLAKRCKARLVLVGRSMLSEEKRAKIREIEAFDSEVMYLQGDISKWREAKRVVKLTKERFGEINGIIHSAGLIKDAFIINKNREEIEAVLAAKVCGTVIMDKITKNENLDFFILFSSIAGVIGNIGQSDYAYGNAFLDNYAEERENLRKNAKRYGKTLSINWPLWEEGGMSVDEEKKKLIERTTGMVVLTTEKGIKAFEDALRLKAIQLIVIERRNKASVKQSLKFDSIASGLHRNGDVFIAEGTSELKFEQELTRIFSELLGIKEEELDVKVNLIEYGLHSIMIMKMVNRLEEMYGITIEPNAIAEHPTINSFAKYLADKMSIDNNKKLV